MSDSYIITKASRSINDFTLAKSFIDLETNRYSNESTCKSGNSKDAFITNCESYTGKLTSTNKKILDTTPIENVTVSGCCIYANEATINLSPRNGFDLIIMYQKIILLCSDFFSNVSKQVRGSRRRYKHSKQETFLETFDIFGFRNCFSELPNFLVYFIILVTYFIVVLCLSLIFYGIFFQRLPAFIKTNINTSIELSQELSQRHDVFFDILPLGLYDKFYTAELNSIPQDNAIFATKTPPAKRNEKPLTIAMRNNKNGLQVPPKGGNKVRPSQMPVDMSTQKILPLKNNIPKIHYLNVLTNYFRIKNPNINESTLREYANLTIESGIKFGIAPSLVAGIIISESTLRHDTFHGSIIGLMQINWSAHKKGLTSSFPKYIATQKDLFDPKNNIFAGTWIFSNYLRTEKGNERKALYRYVGGANHYYVNKVINIKHQIEQRLTAQAN